MESRLIRDREAPGSNSSSPWLYIQSEALQDIAFHLMGMHRLFGGMV